MQSFILPANGAATPKSIERKRKMAEAMLANGMDASPIASPWQGAARMANALVGGLSSRKADKQEADGSMAAKEALIKALNGGDNSAVIDAISNPFTDNNSLPFLKDKYSQLNPDPSGAGGAEYGLQPIITQDENGKYHLFQAAKDGSAPKEMPLPYGWTPQQQYLDTGTDFQAMPKVGFGQGAVVPKDLAGAEAAKEVGTAQGKAIAAAPADMQAADNALALIDQIETDPNLDLGVGMTSLGNVIPGTPGRDFQSRVDQAKSGAFLSAIQQLRGMGSLSNAEGDTATKAVTRLNTATSKEEFLSALRDYRQIVQIGKDRAASRLGPQAQPIPQPMSVPDVSTMSDEDLQAIINGP